MADTGIFATTAQVSYKVGAGASATANTEAYINSFLFQAESYVNSICRYNFSDNYSTLNDDTKGILQEAATDIAAIYVIQFDMSGYTSRIEAEDMINVLRDAYLRAIQILRDKKVSDFIREVA